MKNDVLFDRPRFNLIAGESFDFDGHTGQTYQIIGPIEVPLGGLSYRQLLDASLTAMINKDLVGDDQNLSFGLRMSGDDVVSIDALKTQFETISSHDGPCRKLKDTKFPPKVDNLATDRYPKYIIDTDAMAMDGSDERYYLRRARPSDLIPLCYRVAWASTCHGMLLVVFWGDVTLERLKSRTAWYRFYKTLYHTVFTSDRAYENYLVIDSMSEYTRRKNAIIGDPYIGADHQLTDNYYYGWPLEESEPVEPMETENHKIGKAVKERNVTTARSSVTGNNPASTIMKTLLRGAK